MPPSTRLSVATRPGSPRRARPGSATALAVLVACLAVIAPLAGSGSFGTSGLASLGGGPIVGRSAAGDGAAAVLDAAAADAPVAIGAAGDALRVDPFGGAPAPDAVPASAPADRSAGPAGPADSAVEPSIQYDDAAAHAEDPNRFTPGGVVAVPYRPSAKDAWAVDGGGPLPLPAGSASGRAIAVARQGSDRAGRPAVALGPGVAGTWADGASPDGASPVDGPSVARVAAIPAVATAPASAPDAMPAAGTNLHRQVFGFLPYWTLADRSTVIDYGLLSTIAYFSVGADRAGNLLKKGAHGSTTTGWGGWTSSKLTSVISAAHRAHTRVVLTVSVFAWTSGQAALQSALLGSPAARLTLARQLAAAVRERGADGVNLDFEPIAAGHSADFTALVRTVRSQLDRVHRGYQLTFDTTGLIGNYPIEDATAPGGADAIFIMGYDYRTGSATTAGSIDPLDGSGYTLTDTIAAYTQRVAASKLILGLPYYGRAWSTTTSALGAPTRDGATFGRSASVSYATAAQLGRRYGLHYDPTAQVAWFAYRTSTCTSGHGCATGWREVYFNDARALKARYDLVIQSGLRGTGIWALGYDETRPELYRAISQKFVHDTTAPVTGVAVLSPTVGDAGFVVSWRSADVSAIRSYDVQVSVDGGPWRAWRTATTVTSDVFLGVDAHAYAFRARATDVAGNVGSWDVGSRYDATPSLAVGGFGRIAIDAIAARTSADTSALRVATLMAGQTVAIVGGPRSADGYTWYQVTGPLAEWDTVGSTRTGMWIPVRTASRSFVSAAVAPNATVVNAGIDALTFGDIGAASLGHASLALVARVFSPNDDGSRDRLRLRWKNHITFDSMTLRILRPDGRLVGTRTLPDRGPGAQSYDWDGRLASGRAVPDGTYVLQLVSRARGRTYSAPSSRPTTAAQVTLYAVTLDRVPPLFVSATSTAGRISPNGDGRSDSVTVTATSTGATGWTFVVAPVTGSKLGSPVRTVSGSGSRAVVRWNGRSDAGAIVPDGTYRLSMIAWDPAGNRVVRSGTIVVDDRPATVAFVVGPARISPDGDGAADAAVASWTSSEPVRGIVSLVHGSTTIRTWVFGTSLAHAVGWNGRDTHGRPVKEGTYVVRLRAYDATGNFTLVERRVVVDRTVSGLSWAPAAFDPQDGDRLLPSSRVSFTLTRSATVSLRIIGPTGAVVRTALIGRHLSTGRHGWTWDGRAAGGPWVAPGAYTAVLQVRSSQGTTILERPIFVGAFTIAPSATVLRAGQTLTITVASVEPLGAGPTVTFRQAGGAAQVHTSTPIGGGRYQVTFRIAAHRTGPATIVVTAPDADGRTNQASTAIRVR